MGGDDLIEQQKAYYRARAGEYDEWFERRGPFDLGPDANARWFGEVAEVERGLDGFPPAGEVLELACGTGWWTERLARAAERLTCLDASPEVIERNRARVGRPDVRYLLGDVFEFRPDRLYDAVFFGFWLSHVPPERFAAFWDLVRGSLRPGGRAFFVDSLNASGSVAGFSRHEELDGHLSKRRLNDGREFTIVKLYYRPDTLSERLAALGWRAAVQATERFFIYGWAEAG